MTESVYNVECTYQKDMTIIIVAESEEAAKSRINALLDAPNFDYCNPPHGVAIELGAGEYDIHEIYPEDDGEEEEEEDLPDED